MKIKVMTVHVDDQRAIAGWSCQSKRRSTIAIPDDPCGDLSFQIASVDRPPS